jgi:hypothetical protein
MSYMDVLRHGEHYLPRPYIVLATFLSSAPAKEGGGGADATAAGAYTRSQFSSI